MTKEQKEKALAFLKDMQECTYDGVEEIRTAIEALEKKHCEDCVSRQDVLDLMQIRMGAKELYKAVYDLPSVTPTRKKGTWIRVDNDKVKCSECEVVHFIAQYPHGAINYCPNCGSQMSYE